MLLSGMLRSSKIFVEKMEWENETTLCRNLSKRTLFANYKVSLNFTRTPIIFSIKKRMPFWTPSLLVLNFFKLIRELSLIRNSFS